MKKYFTKLLTLFILFFAVISLSSCEPDDAYLYHQIREKPWVIENISSPFSPFRIHDVIFFYSEGRVEVRDEFNRPLVVGHWNNDGDILYMNLDNRKIRAYVHKEGLRIRFDCQESYNHQRYIITCYDGWSGGYYY